MITGRWYLKARKALFDGQIDFLAHDIRLVLLGSAYTPDQANHERFSDLTGEVVGAGYVPGGKAMTGKTVTINAATKEIVLDADDAVWLNSSLSVRTVVMYDATADILLAYQQSDSDVVSTNDNFTVTIASLGRDKVL